MDRRIDHLLVSRGRPVAPVDLRAIQRIRDHRDPAQGPENAGLVDDYCRTNSMKVRAGNSGD